MLVELKNGETLNGHLVTCDTWMNLTLKEVVQTSPVCLPTLLYLLFLFVVGWQAWFVSGEHFRGENGCGGELRKREAKGNRE